MRSDANDITASGPAWPEGLPVIKIDRSYSHLSQENFQDINFPIGESASVVPFVARFVEHFWNSNLPGEIGWDKEVPRRQDKCGVVVMRPVAFDAHLRHRLAFTLMAGKVDVRVVRSVVLKRPWRLALKRFAKRFVAASLWLLLLFILMGAAADESTRIGVGILVTAGIAVTDSWLTLGSINLDELGCIFMTAVLYGMGGILVSFLWWGRDLESWWEKQFEHPGGFLVMAVPVAFALIMLLRGLFRVDIPPGYKDMELNADAYTLALQTLVRSRYAARRDETPDSPAYDSPPPPQAERELVDQTPGTKRKRYAIGVIMAAGVGVLILVSFLFHASQQHSDEQMTTPPELGQADSAKDQKESAVMENQPKPAPAVTAASQTDGLWTNSLGMVFVPLETPLKALRISMWQTRMRDYDAFALATTTNYARYFLSRYGPKDTYVNKSSAELEEFAKWLTEKEIREGVLEKGHVYRLPTDEERRAVGGVVEGNLGSRLVIDKSEEKKGWPRK